MPAEPTAPPEAAPAAAGEETMEVPAPATLEDDRPRRRWFRRRRSVDESDEFVPADLEIETGNGGEAAEANGAGAHREETHAALRFHGFLKRNNPWGRVSMRMISRSE